ncbi:MAG: phosphatase PAP2 family protein [Nocardioidaceae bacterium]
MNYDLLKDVNGLAGHSQLLDDVMSFCAKYLIFGVFLVLALVGIAALRRRDWWGVLKTVITLVLAFVLGVVAAKLYTEPRPFTTHPRLDVLVHHAAGQSFPSDHATAAFAIGLALLFFLSRVWGVVALVAAVIIGFARVFDAIHYPGDILGSFGVAVVALAVVLIGSALIERRPNRVTAGAGTSPR